MTEIEKKALALLNEIRGDNYTMSDLRLSGWGVIFEALCRAIEKHEAYKQEVSDAVESYFGKNEAPSYIFARFIIPKPTVDPLIEVIGECDDGTYGETKAEYAAKLREGLAKRGLKIVETGQ